MASGIISCFIWLCTSLELGLLRLGLSAVFFTNSEDRELGFCPILENMDMLFCSNPEEKEVFCSDLQEKEVFCSNLEDKEVFCSNLLVKGEVFVASIDGNGAGCQGLLEDRIFIGATVPVGLLL